LDRLLTHDLEGVVVDCPTIGVSFAFHRGIVSQYDNTFDRLSNTLKMRAASQPFKARPKSHVNQNSLLHPMPSPPRRPPDAPSRQSRYPAQSRIRLISENRHA
ncbi:hypothetical protein, partial [Azotobacter chroococcum]|uniref:hypothetical protein n=1 Tax=Azotobacter chroococcum TaxID=353 RepID=UPI001B8D6326